MELRGFGAYRPLTVSVLVMNAYPAYIDVLLLLFVANGAPILADCVCRHRLTLPVDGGLMLLDGRPLFGGSKTVRGLIASIGATTCAALLLGYPAVTGFLFGSLAMLGDLLSSFIKRRYGWPSTSKAFLLDQIPESLVPTVALASQFELTAATVVTVVTVFVLLAVTLARLLYLTGIRKQPH